MVESLFALALRACCENAHEVWSVGDLPYYLVQPIMENIIDGKQLRAIEENSSDVQGNNSEIWKRLIKRDFSTIKIDKHIKQGLEDGTVIADWSLYEQLSKQLEQISRESEEILRASTRAILDEKMDRSITIHDAKKMPTIAKNGAALLRGNRVSASRDYSLQNGHGSRGPSGAGVMNKLRRETAVVVARRANLIMPPSAHGRRLGHLNRAPEAMVTEKRIEAQPVSLSRPSETRKRQAVDDLARGQQEARLLEAKRIKVSEDIAAKQAKQTSCSSTNQSATMTSPERPVTRTAATATSSAWARALGARSDLPIVKKEVKIRVDMVPVSRPKSNVATTSPVKASSSNSRHPDSVDSRREHTRGTPQSTGNSLKAPATISPQKQPAAIKDPVPLQKLPVEASVDAQRPGTSPAVAVMPQRIKKQPSFFMKPRPGRR